MTGLLICDFESAFGDDYTLSKITTEKYVRSERFKTLMFGYWWPAEMAAPAECNHEMLLSNEPFRRKIEASTVCCHHAHFDGLILSHVYNLRPKHWLDTLSMARLVLPRLKSHSLGALAQHFNLPEKNVPYNLFKNLWTLPPDIRAELAAGCIHDIELTYSILQKLLPQVPAEELSVIDITIRLFTEPVLELDKDRMFAFAQAEKKRKALAMLQAGHAMGLPPLPSPPTLPDLMTRLDEVEAQLQSSAQFKLALEALGVECPMKPSHKIPGEFIPAIAKSDQPMKDLLEHEDIRVRALAGARLGVKSTIDETRADRLLDSVSRGPLPVYLIYAAAKTLRFGGGDKTNWHNFRRGGEIRKSIMATSGHKLVIADAAQVECRGVNWLAGETWVLDAFAAGRDVYCETASKIFERPITKEDKFERFNGKTVELGAGFGLGWKKYQAQMKVGMLGGPSVVLSDQQAQRGVSTYRDTHPHVVEYWRTMGDYALPLLANGGEGQVGCMTIKDHKFIGPNGAFMDYGGMYWGYFGEQPEPDEHPQWWHPGKRGMKSKYYGGKLTENVTQFLWSGLFIRQAMRQIGARYKIVFQCHDEIICCVPDNEAQACYDFMLKVLRTPPAWAPDIPLDAEGIISQNYSK